MPRRLAAVAVLLLFLGALPAVAQWRWGRPNPPRGGACFYREPGFSGLYFCMRAGEDWPALPSGFNDRIISVRVFGGTRVRVFNDANFSGPSLLVAGDIPDLRAVSVGRDIRRSWAARISSIAVFRGRDRWGGPPPTQPYGRPY